MDKTTLQALRHEKNITQAELASFLGVKKNTISGWEHGARSPGIHKAKQIALFFGVSVEQIRWGAEIRAGDLPRAGNVRHKASIVKEAGQ